MAIFQNMAVQKNCLSQNVVFWKIFYPKMSQARKIAYFKMWLCEEFTLP